MVEIQKPNEKIKIPAMIKALRDARGIKAAAARLLNCDSLTVDNYIKKYASVRAAYDEAAHAVSDIARGNVVGAIIKGDLAESHWWLTKKDPTFKDRIENVHTGDPNQPIVIEVVYK